MGLLTMDRFGNEAGVGSTFSSEKLHRASQFAAEEGLFQRLNELYATVPEGECQGCADCCMESVETHWIEFLHIYDHLQKRPEILQKLRPNILRFYLLEGVIKLHCPFQIEQRRCAIYPVRPLPCRLFGQWGAEDYAANYAVTLRNNQASKAYYQERYKLVLPDTVVNHLVPYCQRFIKPQDLTMDDFYDLLDGIMAIQSRLLMEGLVDEDFTAPGLVSWWMGAWFDLAELQDVKAGVMEGYLAGRMDRFNIVLKHLQGMINRK